MQESPLRSGRLTKISDNFNALRTNGVLGSFHAEPIVSSYFSFYSDSLTPGLDHRVISTSIVTSVVKDGDGIIFRTLNSAYLLEVFD